MTERYPALYRFAQFMALLATALAALFPGLLERAELPLATALILLLGIPHGATDHLIFLQLNKSFLGGKQLDRFYFLYLLLMVAYGFLWWLLPTIALGVFLLLSVYHFGQSNWNYAGFGNKTLERFTYLIWGAWVLLVPILWHYDDASVIISGLIGGEAPLLPIGWRQAMYLGLLTINIWLTVYLWAKQIISQLQLRDEIIHLLIFCLLFTSTPLLLGFVVYFVFWHSIGSIADQIRFFSRYNTDYSWKNYVRQAFPLSLAAVAGLGLLYTTQTYIGVQPNIGLLFIFISIVTLPHMILIDLLYGEWDTSEAPQTKRKLQNS